MTFFIRVVMSFLAVLSCLVCLVTAQQYTGDFIANKLPVVNGANLTYFNIADPKAKAARLTLLNYMSLNSKGQRVDGPSVKRAVIVIHGLNRDPGTYMANMLSALAQVPNSDVNSDSVAICAPYFPNGNDKNVGYPWTDGLAAGKGSTTSALVWQGSQWADGTNNQYPSTSKTVSSYEAIDQLVKYFDNKSIFPNMQQIVVAGHSLGSQTVHRYIAVGNVLSITTPVLYYVANPNSYLWFTSERPLDTSTCPTYDVWRDGLTNYSVANSYATTLVNQGRAAVLARYNSRQIAYQRGLLDTGDDSSDCDPFTTGANRNERFFNFIKAFPPTCSTPSNCDTVDLVQIGHDAGSMFASPAGQARLFLDNFNGTGKRAYDFGYPRVQAGDDPYPDPVLSANQTTGGTVTYAGNMTYAGCWTDPGPKSLAYQAYSSENNTIELCTSTCNAKGYSIAGMEFGAECYCGNVMTSKAQLTSDQGCTQACAGNSSQNCGNAYRLSVYSNGTPKVLKAPSAPSTIGKFTYQGCYKDNNPGRALNDNSMASNTLTLESCAAFCSGYNWFGTEWSSECYCGNTLGAGSGLMPASDCSKTCSGADDQLCGDGNRLTLYAVNASAVVSSSSSPTTSTSSSTSVAISQTSSTTSTSSTPTATSSLVCPDSNGVIYTAASGKTYLVECSIDHAGGDLTMVYVDSLTKCIDACDATTGCLSWSYVATVNGGNSPCYLKSAIGFSGSNSGVMGGKFVSSGSSSTSAASSTSSSTSSSSTTSTTSATTSASSTSSSSSISSSAAPTVSALVCPGSNGAIYTAASGKTFQVECGNDHGGGDLRMIYVDTLVSCINACDTTAGCVAYSWVSQINGANNPCYLKSAIGPDNLNSGIMGGKLVAMSASTASSSSTSCFSTSSPSTSASTSSSSTSTSTTSISSTSSTSSTAASAPTILACPSSNGNVYTASSGKTYQVECYNDHAAGDLKMIYVDTLVGCINACDSTTGCVAYSWVSQQNGVNSPCYMKSTIGANQVNNGVWGGKFVAAVVGSSSPSSTTTSITTTNSVSSTSATSSTSPSTSASTSTSSTTSASSTSTSGTSLTTTLITTTSSSSSSSSSSTSTTSTSTTPSLPSGVSALGCYTDPPARALSTRVYSNSSNTPSTCALTCRQQGYKYSGTEYSSECWCGNSAPDTTTALSPSACDMTCSGDRTQICGDGSKLNIYIDSTWKQTFFARPSYGSWALMSCYTDGGSRTLPTSLATAGGSSVMTAATCLDACTSSGLKYCGLEYYGECYGAAAKPAATLAISGDPLAAGCNYPCRGNSTEACGGSNRILVYVDQSKP